MLRSGVDIVEIERFRTVLERHAERFPARIFTAGERLLCGKKISSLAARFAAKEAVAKALGCGIGPISWLEIEILRGPNGEPLLFLHGQAQRLADELRLREWTISLSHTTTQAIAMVVATT